MASKGGIKGFYRQKKTGGVTKKTGGVTKKSASSFGSNITQPSALISHGSVDLKDDYGVEEEVLRQLDLNMRYGPCCGMSRLDRFKRAVKLGLNPPKEVEGMLVGGKVGMGCLWDGRI